MARIALLLRSTSREVKRGFSPIEQLKVDAEIVEGTGPDIHVEHLQKLINSK